MGAVPMRYRAVCWAPVLTGARPGELFAMRREDIDRASEMIYLHQTADRYGRITSGLKSSHHVREKGRRGRWTLFPRPLIELCDELPSVLSGWLFVSPRSRVWGQRNFYRGVWDPARRASGTDFTLYDLRHTFSSRLIAAGIPLPEVAAWMGHSLRAGGVPVNTTATTYTHATGEFRRQALDELCKLFRRPPARARVPEGPHVA
jgi:integrase